ncbi:hypothetical protein JZ751_015046 [Albula glossodonta]|uniref:Nerve growth factor-related domain-containing protein n=1 Tax=Albula glossodonta TaxID=121402 RepID=A0A8T2NRI4_9TELE|nr:hypothetical protein JZ751_015046 [Albula glossodonta]
MHWLPLVAMVIASALPFPHSPIPRLVTATPDNHTAPEPSRNLDNHTSPAPNWNPDNHTSPEPNRNPGNHAAPETNRNPGNHTAPETNRNLGNHTAPEPIRSPGNHTAPEPNRNLGNHTAPEPNRNPGNYTAPEPNRNPGNHTSPEPNRNPGNHTSPEPNRNPGNHTAPEPNRNPGNDTAPEPNRNPGNHTAPEPNRNPGNHTAPEPNWNPGNHTVPEPSRNPDNQRNNNCKHKSSNNSTYSNNSSGVDGMPASRSHRNHVYDSAQADDSQSGIKDKQSSTAEDFPLRRDLSQGGNPSPSITGQVEHSSPNIQKQDGHSFRHNPQGNKRQQYSSTGDAHSAQHLSVTPEVKNCKTQGEEHPENYISQDEHTLRDYKSQKGMSVKRQTLQDTVTQMGHYTYAEKRVEEGNDGTEGGPAAMEAGGPKLLEEAELLFLDAHPRVLFTSSSSPPKHPPLLLMLEAGLHDRVGEEERDEQDERSTHKSGEGEAGSWTEGGDRQVGRSTATDPITDSRVERKGEELMHPKPRPKRASADHDKRGERSVCEPANEWVTDKKTAIDMLGNMVTVLPEIQTPRGTLKQYFFETKCRQPDSRGTGGSGVSGRDCVGVDKKHWVSECRAKQSYVRALTAHPLKGVGWSVTGGVVFGVMGIQRKEEALHTKLHISLHVASWVLQRATVTAFTRKTHLFICHSACFILLFSAFQKMFFSQMMRSRPTHSRALTGRQKLAAYPLIAAKHSDRPRPAKSRTTGKLHRTARTKPHREAYDISLPITTRHQTTAVAQEKERDR